MKPALGYPSRIAAIYGLRRQGKTERQIGEMLGIKPNTVTSLEARARQRGYRGQQGKRPGAVRLSGAALVDLQEEAATRGVTTGRLAETLLGVIARDDLFAAVLDS